MLKRLCDDLKACACLLAFIGVIVVLIAEATAVVWFPLLCVFCGYMAGRG